MIIYATACPSYCVLDATCSGVVSACNLWQPTGSKLQARAPHMLLTSAQTTHSLLCSKQEVIQLMQVKSAHHPPCACNRLACDPVELAVGHQPSDFCHHLEQWVQGINLVLPGHGPGFDTHKIQCPIQGEHNSLAPAPPPPLPPPPPLLLFPYPCKFQCLSA